MIKKITHCAASSLLATEPERLLLLIFIYDMGLQDTAFVATYLFNFHGLAIEDLKTTYETQDWDRRDQQFVSTITHNIMIISSLLFFFSL
jgi:hypothetical protein